MKPKIGVIVCGFIENKQFVTNAYIQSIRYSGGIPLILPLIRSNQIIQEYRQLCDGFLFCGGNDITPLLFGQEPQKGNGQTNISLDLFQIRLMKEVLKTRKPVFSICRGMQVFNVACGGTIFRIFPFSLAGIWITCSSPTPEVKSVTKFMLSKAVS